MKHDEKNNVNRFLCHFRSNSTWAIDTAEYTDGPDGYWKPEKFQEFWNLPDWAIGPNTPYLEMARDTEKVRAWLRDIQDTRPPAITGPSVGQADPLKKSQAQYPAEF